MKHCVIFSREIFCQYFLCLNILRLKAVSASVRFVKKPVAGSPTGEHRRRKGQGAASAEAGGVWGGGIPLLSRLGGLRERRDRAPPAGSGAEPRPQTHF